MGWDGVRELETLSACWQAKAHQMECWDEKAEDGNGCHALDEELGWALGAYARAKEEEEDGDRQDVVELEDLQS